MFYFSDLLSNLLFFHFENRDRTEGKGQIELWVKSRKTKSRSTGIVKSWYFCLCLLCSIFDWIVSVKPVGWKQGRRHFPFAHSHFVHISFKNLLHKQHYFFMFTLYTLTIANNKSCYTKNAYKIFFIILELIRIYQLSSLLKYFFPEGVSSPGWCVFSFVYAPGQSWILPLFPLFDLEH